MVWFGKARRGKNYFIKKKQIIKMKNKCCLCGKEYEGYGNNAQPLKDGKCCNKCNFTKVIPARLQEGKDEK